MSQRFRNLFHIILGFIVFGCIAWLLYWVAQSFVAYVSAVPKELGAALVAGTATVVVATITVMIGRYFERKKELDALYRDKKMEIYDEFLKKFFDLFFSQSEDHPTPEPDNLVPFLREFMRKLILWSGPQPIAAFLAWKNHLAKGTPDAQTIFLTEQFLFSLRTDLRHSNQGIPKGFFATLVLKEGALFLELAKSNPNITLAQVAEVEKTLREKGDKQAVG
jgi:hypothetical protein